MSRLSDLLNDANTNNLSARRIHAIADARGVSVANTSILKYLRGEPELPSETVLQAFSVALDIPMDALMEAAGSPAGELEPFVLPERANRHNAWQRELVLHTIRVLLNEPDSPQKARSVRAEIDRWQQMFDEHRFLTEMEASELIGVQPASRSIPFKLRSKGQLLGVRRGSTLMYPEFQPHDVDP
jgi:transcriptional regulator with XRE-family HTH domain